MPLATRSLIGLAGLSTEGSPVDPAATPANSLYDCMNVTFSRSGQIVARKGRMIWCDMTTSVLVPAGSALNGVHPTTPSEVGFQVPYSVTGLGGQSAYVSTTGVNPLARTTSACVNVYKGAATDGIRTATGLVALDVGKFGLGLGTPTESYRTRSFFSFNRLYVSADNGLFRGEPDATGVVENKLLKRVMLPIPYTDIDLSTTPTVDTAWLPTGYATRICAVVVEYNDQGQPMESPVSVEVELQNTGYPTCPKIKVQASCINVRDLTRTYFEVYRTKAYKFGTPKEIEFYKCFAVALSDPSITVSATPKDAIGMTNYNELLANDDAISSQQVIYTSVNADGGGDTVNVPIPAANDVTTYKGYTVYAGLRIPPFVQLQMTALPGSAGTDALTIDAFAGGGEAGQTVIMTDQANATSSTTDGKMTASHLSFKGAQGALCDLVIRAIDPKAASLSTSKGVVPYVAQTAAALTRIGTVNGASTVTVTPNPAATAVFSLDKFISPKGCFAVVNAAGNVLDVVTYDDFEQVPTSGKIEFYGSYSVANFATSACWTTAATYYLFPLASADVNNLPIYAIPTDTDVAGTLTQVGYSLLPTFYTYPTYPYLQDPVGYVGGLSLSAGLIKCSPVFFGLLWKPADVRLDKAVRALASNINKPVDLYSPAGRWRTQPYAIYTGEPFKLVLVGVLAGADPIVHSPYDEIYMRLKSTSTVRFDEPIPLSDTTLSPFSEEVSIPCGIIFSKRGRPEAVALSQMLSPIKVGQEINRIMRVSVNNDQLYVFKENEGIYRVSIIEGSQIPQVAQVSVFDNTIYLIGNNCLEELQESIFFLSNKGVLVLNNGQVSNISRQIESQLKNAIVRQAGAVNAIVSFKNEFRRQFGLYFPAVNQTYVYDTLTGQWAIWEARYNSAYSTLDGLTMFARVEGTTGIIERDRYTQGWEDAADQVEAELAVTSTSTTNAADLQPSGITGYFANLNRILTYRTTYKMYYKTAGGGLYPITYVSASGNGMNVTFDDGIIKPDANGVNPVIGSIVLGVKCETTFNRFWAYSSAGQEFQGQTIPSSAQGAMTLTQFTECHLQVAGTQTNLRIGFEADAQTPTFDPNNYVTLPANYDIMRVSVPRNQARGRWLMTKITHDYPYQKFTLAGIGYVFKDLSSFKVKVRST